MSDTTHPKGPNGGEATQAAVIATCVETAINVLKQAATRYHVSPCTLLMTLISEATKELSEELGHPNCALGVLAGCLEAIAERHPELVEAVTVEDLVERGEVPGMAPGAPRAPGKGRCH